jgi:hypothetical protein
MNAALNSHTRHYSKAGVPAFQVEYVENYFSPINSLIRLLVAARSRDSSVSIVTDCGIDSPHKLVGEVSAKICAWSAQRIPTAVNLGFLDPKPLLIHSSSSSVILTRLSGPRSRHTTKKKNLVAPGIEPRTSGSVTMHSINLQFIAIP